nr:EOG090X08S2 [Sida crystallina]
MAKLFDLRPDTNLLDATFEGYKLTLDPLPVYQHELPIGVEHLKPSDEQFSFQHVKSFGYHNHLIVDLWHNDFAYFITKDLGIYRVKLHSLVGQSPEFSSVWKIPHARENKGCFNPTISFAGPHLAIVADGGGKLYIVDTSNRDATDPQPWQIQPSPIILGGDKSSQVVDSYYDEAHSSQIGYLHVLLQHVELTGEVETQIPLSTLACNEKETLFVTLLEHLTYFCRDGHWELHRLRRVAVPHGMEYAALLPPGNSLCVAARKPLGIIYDSLKTVAPPDGDNMDQIPTNDGEPRYMWSETSDEVTIWFSLEKNASKHDVKLEKTTQSIKISYKNETLLDGQLSHGVCLDDSIWTLTDGKLEVLLSKIDKGVPWNDMLIQGKNPGHKVHDAESAAEWHQRLVQLTSEDVMAAQPGGPTRGIFNSDDLEECDESPLEDFYLMRIDGESNDISHQASLGSHSVLFTTSLSPTSAPALCLRHDVDGLVWQPLADEAEASWACTHTATFQALGYVQASKEHRKFTICSPNFSTHLRRRD